MLRIKFFRTGKKNQPFFRIVVADKKNPPRGGRFLEILGFFNPLTKEKNLKAERIKYWLSVGAQPSARVHNLLVTEKVITAAKIDVHRKSKKTTTRPPHPGSLSKAGGRREGRSPAGSGPLKEEKSTKKPKEEKKEKEKSVEVPKEEKSVEKKPEMSEEEIKKDVKIET